MGKQGWVGLVGLARQEINRCMAFQSSERSRPSKPGSCYVCAAVSNTVLRTFHPALGKRINQSLTTSWLRYHSAMSVSTARHSLVTCLAPSFQAHSNKKTAGSREMAGAFFPVTNLDQPIPFPPTPTPRGKASEGFTLAQKKKPRALEGTREVVYECVVKEGDGGARN